MAVLFLEYFYWHFTIAPFEILKIMNNYLRASRHQFLLKQHLATLFAPWHRQNPSDFGPKSKPFTDKALDLVADIYIRLIAACIRLLIILAGLIWQLVILIGFIFLFVVWLGWPVVAIFFITRGLNSLF